MSESEANNETRAKRERSPSFPYIDLSTSIEHLQKLYAAARMNEVRLPDVAVAWSMKPKSGSLMRYVAALGQFGLVESYGSGDQRRIKVSSAGRRILEDDRPGVRERLCSDAALMPKLVLGLYLGGEGTPKWGKDRPSDSIAESSLKFDLNFTGEAARRFLTVYDATIKHVIDSEDATEGVDNGRGEALESEANEPDLKVEAMQSQPQDEVPMTLPPVEVEGTLNDIDYQNAGKGKIKISAVLDSEGLDILEKKIAAFRMLIN